MKYYSEQLARLFDSPEELEQEEQKVLEEQVKKETAETAAKKSLENLYEEVQLLTEDARRMAAERDKAQSQLATEIANFCHDYGYVPEKFHRFFFFYSL